MIVCFQLLCKARAYFTFHGWRLKTHGVENRRRFSTPIFGVENRRRFLTSKIGADFRLRKQTWQKSDDDAVAAAIMHSYSCKS